MAHYLIGDIQGCNVALEALLRTIDFSPSRDTLYPLGDLVNRGEDSLGVLRTLVHYADAVKCVLGNHDWHLLALAHGMAQPHGDDTLAPVLQAADRAELLAWLGTQVLARQLVVGEHRWLLVHAGILPQWSPEQVPGLAREVHEAMQGAQCEALLRRAPPGEPLPWSASLSGLHRLRAIVRATTRLRFCTREGVMEFAAKGSASAAPAGYMPWFEAYADLPPGWHVAFGHWSTLGLHAPNRIFARQGYLGLDSGCVWGGFLSAYEVGSATLVQVDSGGGSPTVRAMGGRIMQQSHAGSRLGSQQHHQPGQINPDQQNGQR